MPTRIHSAFSDVLLCFKMRGVDFPLTRRLCHKLNVLCPLTVIASFSTTDLRLVAGDSKRLRQHVSYTQVQRSRERFTNNECI